MPRHQRGRRGHAQIVTFRLQPFPHFDDIAVALGREHADARGFTLQQRVGGGGGTVDDAGCLLEQRPCRKPQPFGGQTQPLQYPVRLIGWRGGRFSEDRFARGGGHHDVREGAADIDADCICHSGHSPIEKEVGAGAPLCRTGSTFAGGGRC